jgi:hypothetical protein
MFGLYQYQNPNKIHKWTSLSPEMNQDGRLLNSRMSKSEIN